MKVIRILSSEYYDINKLQCNTVRVYEIWNKWYSAAHGNYKDCNF